MQFRLPIDSQNAEVIAGCVEITRRLINNAPTVDAVEVKHGRWEDRYGEKYANHLYECSVCKKTALYKVGVDCLGHEHWVQALTPTCPYCSAKLDGGKSNDI